MKQNIMKKTISLLGAAMLFAASLPFAVYADVSAEEDFICTQTDDGVVITRYVGEDEEIIIPAVIDGSPVTEIGERAFEGNPDIVSVEIPSGVTKIGYHAFTADRGLETVTIASTVTEIEEGVFHECESLSAINYEGDEDSWSGITIDQKNNDAFVALTPEYNAVLTEQESADDGDDADSEEITDENTDENSEDGTESSTDAADETESAADEDGSVVTETASEQTTSSEAADTGAVSSVAASQPETPAAQPEPQSTGGTKLKIIFGVIVGVAVLDILYYSVKKPK